MQKLIKIDSADIPMQASAFTPIAFKREFGRDMIRGIQDLKDSSKKGDIDAEFVAEIAWIMAREANKDIEPFDEWLMQFNMFAIYEALDQIVSLWFNSEMQHSKSAKK